MKHKEKEEIGVKEEAGEIVRFNKAKSLDLFLGIIFIFLCISSVMGMKDVSATTGKLSIGIAIFNGLMSVVSGYFGFMLLLRDKLGYIRLGKDCIGFNKTFKEKKILLKNILKIIKVTKKENLVAYRVVAKGIILEVPMEYYKEEEVNKINAYLKSKGKL